MGGSREGKGSKTFLVHRFLLVLLKSGVDFRLPGWKDIKDRFHISSKTIFSPPSWAFDTYPKAAECLMLYFQANA